VTKSKTAFHCSVREQIWHFKFQKLIFLSLDDNFGHKRLTSINENVILNVSFAKSNANKNKLPRTSLAFEKNKTYFQWDLKVGQSIIYETHNSLFLRSLAVLVVVLLLFVATNEQTSPCLWAHKSQGRTPLSPRG
jgi:hypothetical protein